MTSDNNAYESDHRSGDRPVVVGSDLTRTYTRGRSSFWGSGGERPTVTALDGVSIAAKRGEFVAVSGPSGSGKTTLLHLLAGLDTPTSGEVDLLGQTVSKLGEVQRSRLRLDHVGIVFQRFHLLPALSARANVAVPLIEKGWSTTRRRERAVELLEDVGLGERIDHRPGQLSGGEQQRVAIARALATDPDLLIGDEPTGEVDSETGAAIIDLFNGLADDRAVVIASHDEQVLEAADRVVALRDGQEVH